MSQPSGAGDRVKLSVNEGQIRALKQRGAEFQRAAKEAKAKGDKEKALGYLRYYKGIEPMIGAAESGYPVDMTQVSSYMYIHNVYCILVCVIEEVNFAYSVTI